MGFAEIITLVTAFFKFPSAILEFVKLLQKTPQERHAELLVKINLEAEKFEREGRGTWT